MKNIKKPVNVYLIILFTIMILLGFAFTISGLVISGTIDLQEMVDLIDPKS
jgi:hypothetical protein